MIDFTLSEEQEAIRRLAHDFAVKEIRPVAAHYDETEEQPWDVIKKAHQLGLDPTSEFPEAYGGGGMGSLTTLIMNEELAWGCAGIATAIHATGLAAAGVLACGTEAQKRKYITLFTDPDVMRIGAMGLTEPNAGCDAFSLQTMAKKVDGGYVLNGTKQFITNGGIADLHVIFATTDRTLGPAGIAPFAVEKGAKGLSMGRKEVKMGVRASHTAQVILEDCFVPTASRLGGEPGDADAGPGALGALMMLEHTRPGIGAMALGIARAAFEYSLEYAGQRVQFGKPIIANQGISFKLADMATEIEAARFLVWKAGWMMDNKVPMKRGEASMCKLFAGDTAMKVTVEASQILGGYGYIREYPVEKWMRDAKIYQVWEGTAEIQRMVISRALQGRYIG